jgi:hypothetical protein
MSHGREVGQLLFDQRQLAGCLSPRLCTRLHIFPPQQVGLAAGVFVAIWIVCTVAVVY